VIGLYELLGNPTLLNSLSHPGPGRKEELTVYSNTHENQWDESHYQLNISCSDRLNTVNGSLEIDII